MWMVLMVVRIFCLNGRIEMSSDDGEWEVQELVAELWFSSRIKESYPSRMDGFGGNRGTLVGYATMSHLYPIRANGAINGFSYWIIEL